MFGDIAGFTAWSSVREPSQVFILLESVYSAFDILAKRRRVFKVETVGDCCKFYPSKRRCAPSFRSPRSRFLIIFRCIFVCDTVDVAVTGLPEPTKNHAVLMARFARDCIETFNELVGQLETILGPDTGDLAVRKFLPIMRCRMLSICPLHVPIN